MLPIDAIDERHQHNFLRSRAADLSLYAAFQNT